MAARRPAWLAFVIVDAEMMLVHAEIAVGEPVIAQRRAAILDRGVEHRLDARDQAFGTLVRCAFSVGERRSDAFRRQPRAIQRLANVDIAEAGGSSLRDHKLTDGGLGMFQHNFRVYDREGEKCRTPGCGGTVKRIVQNGRSTFYCPICQK